MPTLNVDTDVVTPAADGTQLAGTLLRPSGSGRHPAVLMRTPYDRKTFASVALQVHAFALAEAGYAVLLQDVRGRGGSAGTFAPFVNEQSDGVATIQWLAEQTWCDGKVGTAGFSYNAFSQLAAATAAPEPLAAWIPSLGPFDIRTSWIRRNGVFDMGFHLAWALGNIAATDKRTADPTALLAAYGDPRLAGNRQPHDQPELAAVEAAAWYFDWLSATDPYPNDARVPSPDHINRVRAPALVIGGWFDVFSSGSAELLGSLRENSIGDGHRFLGGPWDHSGLPFKRRSGDRDFGLGALVDVHPVQLAWFDQHLRGGAEVDLDRAFVTGRNQWENTAAWPPPTQGHDFELAEGELVDGSAAAESLRVDIDHSSPTPVPGGALFPWEPLLRSGAFDQRTRQERADVLVFTSAPLSEATVVAGRPSCRLSIEADGGTTPVYATISESQPGEPVSNVADGVGLTADGHSTKLFFGPIFHEFAAGSRIVLDIAFAGEGRLPNPPGYRSVSVHVGGNRSVLTLPMVL